MTEQQIKLAEQLLASVETDSVSRTDAETFGDWYEHLQDHLNEIHLAKCCELTGINA